MPVLVLQPRLGRAGAAVITGLHQCRLHRVQLVGMGQRSQRHAVYLFRQPANQGKRRRAGETDAAVR